MSYRDLSDEDKLEQAIAFVALGQVLPHELTEFLVQENLYELVTQPEGTHVATSSRKRTTHHSGVRGVPAS